MNEGMWLRLGGTTGRFGNRATLVGMVPSILLHPTGKSVPRSNRALQECVLQGLIGTGSSAYTAANGPQKLQLEQTNISFLLFCPWLHVKSPKLLYILCYLAGSRKAGQMWSFLLTCLHLQVRRCLICCKR